MWNIIFHTNVSPSFPSSKSRLRSVQEWTLQGHWPTTAACGTWALPFSLLGLSSQQSVGHIHTHRLWVYLDNQWFRLSKGTVWNFCVVLEERKSLQCSGRKKEGRRNVSYCCSHPLDYCRKIQPRLFTKKSTVQQQWTTQSRSSTGLYRKPRETRMV